MQPPLPPAGIPLPAAPVAARWRPPSQCEACRSWGAGPLCTDCTRRFALPVPRCPRCALPVAGGATPCGGCLREPPPFGRTHCIADYGFPWDRLIADCKFNGRPELAELLAEHLANALRHAAADRPDLIVPVPLSPARLAERGYNQAWEIARRLARGAGVPARADVLGRALHTPHQADLNRAQRMLNLRGAFTVPPRQRPVVAGRRVALVDDVLTTGATAREAAHALLRAGAAAVDVWVVARTPES